MPDTPTPPARKINVQQTLAELLDIDAKIAAWKDRRDGLRSDLSAAALERWHADGAIPSWRVPRLGSATLVGAETEPTVNVTDDDAYAQWVLTSHPTEAELVVSLPRWAATDESIARALAVILAASAETTIRIPGPTFANNDEVQASCAQLIIAGTATIDAEVQPAFLAALVAGGLADAESGQLIEAEGEIVPGVTVTAKEPTLRVTLNAEAKARAKATIDAVVDDPDRQHDDEGAGDAPPPDEGPKRTTTIEIGDPELEQAPSE